MLKVYGINGRTQAIVKVPCNGGKAWLQLEFKHGRIGAGIGNRPAIYSTTDVTEQNIIEDSPLFGPLIYLHRVNAPSTPKEEVAPNVEYVPGITSKEEAIAYLKERGAKATDLKTDAAMRKFMAKIGVEFPNY